MRWSDLEVFLAAVRTGSYTAAGRQLDVDRTTIGRRVDALERGLGTALFEKTPLGYAPTMAGARLLAAAGVIEREIATMRKDIGSVSDRSAPVRIAGSGGIASEFLPELALFRSENPDVPIELLGDLDAVDAVTQRRADLGIALVRALPLRLAGKQVAVLAQAPYAVTDDLPPIGWGYEFDAALPGGAWSSNPSGEVAQAAGLATVNSWPQLKQAVISGIGRAHMWCFAGDAEADLTRLAEPDPRNDCPMWLVHRGKAPPSPGLSRLIAFLAPCIALRCGKKF